eukprot:s6646_g2.t1
MQCATAGAASRKTQVYERFVEPNGEKGYVSRATQFDVLVNVRSALLEDFLGTITDCQRQSPQSFGRGRSMLGWWMMAAEVPVVRCASRQMQKLAERKNAGHLATRY